jgi:hypothetical protein
LHSYVCRLILHEDNCIHIECPYYYVPKNSAEQRIDAVIKELTEAIHETNDLFYSGEDNQEDAYEEMRDAGYKAIALLREGGRG